MSGSRFSHRLIARVIRATRVVDRGYRLFDRLRSLLVARFAPDGALGHLNDLAYGGQSVYVTGSPGFRAGLFRWEAEAFREWMPGPPARLLVGGAGGGREAFALRDGGYDVVAFEPSAILAAGLNRPGADGRAVHGYQARYEDLPMLTGVAGGPPSTRADTLPRFDAVLAGWASYSHIRTTERRVAALRALADLTSGPILVSFYPAPPAAELRPTGIRRWLDRAGLWSPVDRFTPVVGFYHLTSADEFTSEAREAALQILHLSLDASEGRWPYAVLQRAPRAGGGLAGAPAAPAS